jgi:hypothetical protein
VTPARGSRQPGHAFRPYGRGYDHDMSQEEKEKPDHLEADQDEVGGTDQPRYSEQQEDTGEPGGDIDTENGEGGENDG